MVKNNSGARGPRSHLKYVGIQQRTLKRYRSGLFRFFSFLRSRRLDLPNTLEDLDEYAGEFVNHLYLDDSPLNWASDFLCGLKRLYPRCRKSLGVSASLHKNWVKSLSRCRATPLPAHFVKAMASVALLKGELPLAAACLVGFVGLLRSGEILKLSSSCVGFHGKNTIAVVALPESKGASRKGEPELVCIRDALVVHLLFLALRRVPPGSPLVPGGWKQLTGLLRWSADFFGLPGDKFTPYGFRRGGATWHFIKFHSYDRTQTLGRWADARTARLYIDSATVDMVTLGVLPQKQARLASAIRCLPAQIRALGGQEE